jgi:MFS superfamily sulfate permease-like transporter
MPEVMGYTKIAGTPVITGLYTLLLPVPSSPSRSSRHLVVGADHYSAILATGLLAMGGCRSAAVRRVTSLAALMWRPPRRPLPAPRLIANFLSRSVLIGFLTGVGIQVAMGQVGSRYHW